MNKLLKNTSSRKRAVTLVELLLACAIAAIGITTILVLAADVLKAGVGVTQRNVETAQARVALVRLRNEISQAQTMTAGPGGITLTNSGGKIHWGIGTFSGLACLTRATVGSPTTQKNAVATNVSGVTLSQHLSPITLGGNPAITLGITAGKGHRRMKLQETIRTWGSTL